MTLPPLVRSALLLDLDGTLLDIAPTPDGVVVPPDLIPTLRRLRDRLGGALAVVSGRSIPVLEALLPDGVSAFAGEHGVSVRHGVGQPIERADLPPLPEAWLAQAATLIAATPGAVMERKSFGFTMHYRGSPGAGPRFLAFLQGLLAGQERFQLLGGTMVWEVRPAGIDKGLAVRALMARSPFAGRSPIFIGDDVTDEDGMREARAMGGVGLRVDAAFGTPGDVRRWLEAASYATEWPETGDASA